MANDVCVVLPAAGSGERMGLEVPKQYYTILQKPIVYYTAETLLKIPWIEKVIVVAPPGNQEQMLQALHLLLSLHGEKLQITEGGDTRHKSISIGLLGLKDLNPNIVVIHDGVRPFIPEYILSKVVKAAREHGSAGVVCPLVSTVVEVDQNGFLDHSLDRTKFRASEMPQAFHYSVISAAYSKCSQYDMDHGTECLHLAQKYMGVKAKLIESSSHLWKITYKKDLFAAERIIKGNVLVGILDQSSENEFVGHLISSLSKIFPNVHKVTEDSCYLGHVVAIYNKIKLTDILKDDIIRVCTNFKVNSSVLLIALHSIDEKENFQLLQGKVKEIAHCMKAKNLSFCCITTKSNSTTGSYEAITEMVSSLLLDCNIHLSGQILCL